ncbi:hypothetical protein Tco_0711206 [Tanacetum coccineum]
MSKTLVPRSLLSKKGTRKGRGLSDGVKIPYAITVEKNMTDVHLEEKHVTWAQLGKKLEKTQHLVSQSVETVSRFVTTLSEVKGDDVTTTCDASGEEEEEVEEEVEEEFEEDDLEYFTTFPTREELEYHEWLLKNPRPSWVRAKIRKRSLDNIKI